jgi:hypothetical protein
MMYGVPGARVVIRRSEPHGRTHDGDNRVGLLWHSV